jgi:amino acid adenylation domain-containing protein
MQIEALIDRLIDNKIIVKLNSEGNLDISAAPGSLTPDLLELLKSNKTNLIKFLSEAQGQTARNSIPVTALKANYALSPAQKRMWVLAQIDESSAAYHMYQSMFIRGVFSSTALEAALKTIVNRHEILRTTYLEDEVLGEARQRIISIEYFKFEVEQHDASTQADPRQRAQQIVDKQLAKHIDLEHDAIFRSGVVRLGEEEHMFYFVAHHIAADGVSMNILVEEVFAAYQALANGEKPSLQPLAMQYKDFAEWVVDERTNNMLDAQRKFWLSQFERDIPILNVASDNLRPAIQTYRGSTVRFQIENESLCFLKSFCIERRGTLFMGLAAVLNSLLYHYTNQKDLVIGSPVAGRNHDDLARQVGLYLNTLAIRTVVDPEAGFAGLFEQIRRTTLEAFTHQAYPFDQLVEELNLPRDMSRSPLFDVMLSLENTNAVNSKEQTGTDSLVLESYQPENQISQFDFSFDFVEVGEQLQFDLTYNTDIYSDATAKGLAEGFILLLKNLPENGHAHLDLVSYVNYDLSRFAEVKRSQLNILDRFQEVVTKKPAADAVVFGEATLSYDELHFWMKKFATILLQEHDVKPGDRVALQLPKSEWLPVVILAVLKTGAAFVPIDPTGPAERIVYMLEDAACKLVITPELLNTMMHSKNVAQNNWPTIESTAAAYMIYTSGSTGQPKAVVCEHGALVNISLAWNAAYGLDQFEVRLLQMASIAFDVFVGDIGRTLLNGGTMVLCPDDLKADPASVAKLMQKQRISIIESTPGFIKPLMDVFDELGERPQHLKVLVLGSDTLDINFYKALKNNLQNVRVINSYGVTEATIDSTWFEADVADCPRVGTAPIGRPFNGTEVLVLGPQAELKPAGAIGEIYIGGAGLAKEYHQREQLTKERFVAHPFRANERLYKTGDVGYWRHDGNLQFMGRADDQLKIAGYRIELGEVESVLRNVEQVKDAAVIPWKQEDGQLVLVAFFTADTQLDTVEVRQQMQKEVPAYMVPAHRHQIDQMPLTINDKVDRKALIKMVPDLLELREEFVAPDGPVAVAIATIWQELLNCEEIGIHDDFFALGGHSLKGITLLSRVHKDFNVKVKMPVLFENPTLGAFAEEVQNVIWVNDTQSADLENTDEFII